MISTNESAADCWFISDILRRAGCLYIYEDSTFLLPCSTLDLAASTSSLTSEPSPSLSLVTREASLTLLSLTKNTGLWLQHVLSRAAHWRAEDHDNDGPTGSPWWLEQELRADTPPGHPDAGGEQILWRDFIYIGRRNCSAKLLSSSQYNCYLSDTENTLRPDRLRPIADRFNLDQEAVLDNVLYSRAYTIEQQRELLDFVCAKFHEKPGVFKLLIVDSVMALFRLDFSGRGELAERQQSLAQMMSKLQKNSEEYNVAVLVTNQMTSDLG